MNTPNSEAVIAAMAKVGGCWSPSFSSDGKRLAFVSDLSGIPQVWIVSTQGGWPELVTAIPDQVTGVCWSGDWLAFSLAPGGGMNEQVYLIHPDGTGVRLLTAGGKETNRLGRWLPDGKKLMLASSQRDANAMDVYLADVGSGELRLVAQNKGIGALADVSHDEHYVLLYRLENRGNSNLFLIDLSNGSEMCLTAHDGPGTFNDAHFSPDGRTIYLTGDLDRDLIAFYKLSLGEDGEFGALQVIAERDDAQLDDFTVTRDGQFAALIWNVAGKSELEIFVLTTEKSIAKPVLPTEVIYGPSFSEDGKQLAFVATGSAAPRDIWVYEAQSGEMHQVTYSPHPSIQLDQLVRPELVRFPAHDGLELTAWLYRPQDFQVPGPIVLSFHGGPEGQERPNFSSVYQALLGQGIAVLAPNVRGSGGFGKRFVNLDNGALRVNAVKDIKACVDYVIHSGIGAAGHIGIMGGSYGGYMTMAGLAEFPDVFSAGVNLFGVVNFRTFFAQTEPWMAAISKIEYGDPDTEGEMLDQLSPINKIDRVIAPTLVLHGANDTNVPVVEAEQVVENLKKRGIPVEYVLFPDEGHGFQKEPNRITSIVATVQWFVKYLT